MTPIEIVVGLLSAAAAALGFAIMFRVRKKHLLAMAIGGLLGYAVYLIAKEYFDGEFFPNLLAAVLAAVYCELCAHFLRAPVQIYLIPVLVPLFPGGMLYYSMYYLLLKDYALFADYVIMTLEAALGIAGGMVVGLAVVNTLIATLRRLRKKKEPSKEGGEDV